MNRGAAYGDQLRSKQISPIKTEISDVLAAAPKAAAVCAIAIALGLMVNGARAESYGSDAPNAGISAAKAKPKPVKIAPKHYVVHPQISTSRKRGK